MAQEVIHSLQTGAARPPAPQEQTDNHGVYELKSLNPRSLPGLRAQGRRVLIRDTNRQRARHMHSGDVFLGAQSGTRPWDAVADADRLGAADALIVDLLVRRLSRCSPAPFARVHQTLEACMQRLPHRRHTIADLFELLRNPPDKTGAPWTAECVAGALDCLQPLYGLACTSRGRPFTITAWPRGVVVWLDGDDVSAAFVHLAGVAANHGVIGDVELYTTSPL